MSFHLAKGIDITPNGVIRPGSLQDYRVLRQQPWFAPLLAASTHLRFWVDWPTLQPSSEFEVGDPNGPNHWNLLGLDEQIRLANADGLKVILMPYRYPRWVNGTAHLAGEANLLFEPEDRVRHDPWFAWYDNRSRPAPSMKALEYRLPPDGHGPDSRWGRYVATLFNRWVARADYLEVCNEPNLQLWPQRGPSTRAADLHGRFDVEGSEMTLQRPVAEMIATVEHYRKLHQSDLVCLAPGISDTGTSSPRTISIAVDTPYGPTADPFVPRLLAELHRIGFKGGPKWIWSYHNYGDQERATDRVQYLRRALDVGRWSGLHRDGGPAVAATEGGVRLATIRSIYRPLFGRALTHAEQTELQAKHVERAFHLHRRSTGNGAGVVLFTQYTVTADINFDCALREADGRLRPAFDTWCSLEPFDPRDPLPHEWRPQDDSTPLPGGDGRLDPLPT
jgi:hypothetical protein